MMMMVIGMTTIDDDYDDNIDVDGSGPYYVEDLNVESFQEVVGRHVNRKIVIGVKDIAKRESRPNIAGNSL